MDAPAVQETVPETALSLKRWLWRIGMFEAAKYVLYWLMILYSYQRSGKIRVFTWDQALSGTAWCVVIAGLLISAHALRNYPDVSHARIRAAAAAYGGLAMVFFVWSTADMIPLFFEDRLHPSFLATNWSWFAIRMVLFRSLWNVVERFYEDMEDLALWEETKPMEEDSVAG